MLTPSSISIIVPVYNGGRNWSRVLDALLALKAAPGEILVVDDGSTDDSHQQALERGLEVLRTERPHSGPALARNLGAARARGAVLFFLDSDVLVSADAVERVAHVLSDMSVSAIFGSYDDAPDDPSFVSQYKNLLHHYVHQTSREEATSFWAGCGAIRRDVFRQLGGFSTAYTRPSIEDIELGYRLRRAGGRILLVKDLQVKHLKRWTWRSLLTSDILDRAFPWAELIIRERDLPADLNLQGAHRLSAILCWLMLAAIAGAFVFPNLWIVVPIIAAALLALNLDLYRFFLVKRGIGFALRAIPLHWFYYLYSSAAFGWVLVSNLLRSLSRADAQPSTDKPERVTH